MGIAALAAFADEGRVYRAGLAPAPADYREVVAAGWLVANRAFGAFRQPLPTVAAASQRVFVAEVTVTNSHLSLPGRVVMVEPFAALPA